MLQLRADHLSGDGIPCGAEPHILTYGLYFFARIAQSVRGYISPLFLSVSVRATHCQPVECIFTAGLWWFVCAQQAVNLRILFRRFVVCFVRTSDSHIGSSHRWGLLLLRSVRGGGSPLTYDERDRAHTWCWLTCHEDHTLVGVLTVLHDGTTFMTNGHVLTAVRDGELVHSPCFADTCRAP